VNRFRPQLGFTLLCLPFFALLVGLGVWQLERLQWKLGLIAQIQRNMHAPAISLDQALQLGIDHAQYRRVAAAGTFANSKENYVYATGPEGQPGYHILTPFVLESGGAVMIDRGYVPLSLRSPASRPGIEPQGRVRVLGILHMPDKPGFFAPPPNLHDRVWFARDVEAMARRDHQRLVAPIVLEAVAARGPRWPQGGQTRVDLPNDHLQYALIWFLLAGALAIIWLAWHRARGRLRF
jgi:surfeit locus 1 family protein